jgi:hypothetical protein
MKYDRTVIAYHGCDAGTAERLLRGEPFKKSQNDYDWLGSGIYFWEYGADRALRFAHDQRARGKVETPAIVGALIQLGRCFDLMDTRFTEELPLAFELFKKVHEHTGKPLPRTAARRPTSFFGTATVPSSTSTSIASPRGPSPMTRSDAASSRVRQRSKEAGSVTVAMFKLRCETLLAWSASSGPQ